MQSGSELLAELSSWCDREGDTHVVQLYNDDSLLIEELTRYIGAALGSGHSAVVIATKPHRDALAKSLARNGFDLSVAIQNGRCILLDAAETLEEFLVRDWPDEVRFRECIGGIIAQAKSAARSPEPRVAAFGEMVAVLCGRGKHQAAIRLEQLWNELLLKHRFTLCCAYPTTAFDAANQRVFEEVCAEHLRIFPPDANPAK